MRGTKNLLNLIPSNIYRIKNNKDSNMFWGLEIYLGQYGSGKTLDCVNRAFDICNQVPSTIVISNVEIFNIDNFYLVDSPYEFLSKLIELKSNNENSSIVCIIDEVKVFLTFLDLPQSIEYRSFFTILTQLRKLGIYMMFTSQTWSRVQKPLREYILQNGQIILCKKLIPCFTLLCYLKMGDLEENSKNELKNIVIRRRDYIIHTIELYTAYNTYSVISGIKDLFNKEEDSNGDTKYS